ncbi:MAG: hypothetical protein JWN15_952 [Firmicutes bacterium]|nr:hypothetical protein [Bacillota bacterium]
MANEFMTTMLETMEKHLTTKSVMGEPINYGDVTLVPVMDLMFGAGGGGGEGEKDQGSGAGGGMGARLSPKAVIVIKNGEAQVLQLGKGGAIDKIVDAIPELITKFGAMRGQKAAPAAEPKAE